VLPPHAVGTVTGLGGCVGALVGLATQQAIGWTVGHISFTPVFAVCSVVHLTAFIIVGALVGEIGRIRRVD
jgi:sugar phosphate permease